MELLVYTAFGCSDCRVAKRFLQQHNIPYKEMDIETTPGAAEEVVRQTGKRAVPQFVVDGRWVQPYRPGEGFLTTKWPNFLALQNFNDLLDITFRTLGKPHRTGEDKG